MLRMRASMRDQRCRASAQIRFFSRCRDALKSRVPSISIHHGIAISSLEVAARRLLGLRQIDVDFR